MKYPTKYIALTLIIAVAVSAGMIYFYTYSAPHKDEHGSGADKGSRPRYRIVLPNDPAIDYIEANVNSSLASLLEVFPNTYMAVKDNFTKDSLVYSIVDATYKQYIRLNETTAYGRLITYMNTFIASTVAEYYLTNNKQGFIEELSDNLTRAAAMIDEIRRDLNYTYENIGVFFANKELTLVMLLENIYSSALYAARNNSTLTTSYEEYIGNTSIYDPNWFTAKIWRASVSVYYVLYLYPWVHEVIHSAEYIDMDLRLNITINYIDAETRILVAEKKSLYNRSYQLFKEYIQRHGLTDFFAKFFAQKLRIRAGIENNTAGNNTSATEYGHHYDYISRYISSIVGLAKARACYYAIQGLINATEKGIQITRETLRELEMLGEEAAYNLSMKYRYDPGVAYSIYVASGSRWIILRINKLNDTIASMSGVKWLLRYYYMGYLAYYRYYVEADTLYPLTYNPVYRQ